MQFSAKRYGWNLLIALDQLGNALLGGDPDETISSRAGKNRHRWHWNALSVALDWIDPGHTTRARENDEGSNSAFTGRSDTRH